MKHCLLLAVINTQTTKILQFTSAKYNKKITTFQLHVLHKIPKSCNKVIVDMFNYRGAGKSLARPGRKQANVFVRMAWISFGALPCRKKKLWQLASRCCWNRARPWRASELVSFLVGLRNYQHTGIKRRSRQVDYILRGILIVLIPQYLNLLAKQRNYKHKPKKYKIF